LKCEIVGRFDDGGTWVWGLLHLDGALGIVKLWDVWETLYDRRTMWTRKKMLIHGVSDLGHLHRSV